MKIVLLDSLTLGSDIDLAVFSDFGEIEIYPITNHDEVRERIKDADIIITNKVILGAEEMDFAKNLKLICISATGMNNVDLDAAVERNVVVKNVAGYSTNSVAQHTFAMLFHLLEKNPYYDKLTKTGGWSRMPIFTNLDRPFFQISGKRWGIIGLGEIGRSVANVATAFGTEVVYYSTSGANNNSQYQRCETLEELLSTSDIISIHAPLNDQTKDLIRYAELKLLKPKAIILNLGRGAIINEVDMARAIDEFTFSHGTDVLEREPMLVDHPYLTVKNQDRLFITPHIAWASIEARQLLIDKVYNNIKVFLNK